jgi:hypothetical protein
MSGESALEAVVREVEVHAARAGWDQPAQLFALVDTAELLEREPQLAELLGVSSGPAGGSFTPVEQESTVDSLEELLPTILWPPEVAGCAVVLEATSVPPGAEGVPGDAEAAAAFAAEHPEAQDVRIVAGVLRSGASWCAVRHRAHDEDDMVLTGDDLVPALLQLLHTTLEPDAGDTTEMTTDE